MNVLPVACRSDNYAYLIWSDDKRDALVVDPSECGPIERVLHDHNLTLVGILCTHHHWDHVGGVEELCRSHSGLAVYCSELDVPRIGGATIGLRHQTSFTCGGLDFSCLHVPGHTLGALAYRCDDVVFTGDTLFGGGCGRLFEGTAEQLHTSLMLLASLPDEIKVYFGHEYTRSNLAFARSIEGSNTALLARQQRAALATGTTPSTVGQERETNPFLRCPVPGVRHALGEAFVNATDVEVFAELRRRKDGFHA